MRRVGGKRELEDLRKRIESIRSQHSRYAVWTKVWHTPHTSFYQDFLSLSPSLEHIFRSPLYIPRNCLEVWRFMQLTITVRSHWNDLGLWHHYRSPKDVSTSTWFSICFNEVHRLRIILLKPPSYPVWVIFDSFTKSTLYIVYAIGFEDRILPALNAGPSNSVWAFADRSSFVICPLQPCRNGKLSMDRAALDQLTNVWWVTLTRGCRLMFVNVPRGFWIRTNSLSLFLPSRVTYWHTHRPQSLLALQ